MARPRFYAEAKKNRGLRLSDLAWEGWSEFSDHLGLSRSEIIERLGRGICFSDHRQNTIDQLALLVTHIHNRDNELR